MQAAPSEPEGTSTDPLITAFGDGLAAGLIGNVAGISAGVITCKLLSKAPGLSDSLVGKLCIIGISGTVAWKVREVATHQLCNKLAEC